MQTNRHTKQFDFIVEYYLRKGHALMGMKDFSQATTTFNKVLEIQPNNQLKKEFYFHHIYKQNVFRKQ